MINILINSLKKNILINMCLNDFDLVLYPFKYFSLQYYITVWVISIIQIDTWIMEIEDH